MAPSYLVTTWCVCCPQGTWNESAAWLLRLHAPTGRRDKRTACHGSVSDWRYRGGQRVRAGGNRPVSATGGTGVNRGLEQAAPGRRQRLAVPGRTEGQNRRQQAGVSDWRYRRGQRVRTGGNRPASATGGTGEDRGSEQGVSDWRYRGGQRVRTEGNRPGSNGYPR